MRTQSIVVYNRPYALTMLRLLALLGLAVSMLSSTLAHPAAAADKPEFPPCAGMLFNIAIESTGPDRIVEYSCTLRVDEKGQPVFHFAGNAICGKNSQVAFSGDATLTDTLFHAHITCSAEYDPSASFDGGYCKDGTYVVFILNGKNAGNADLTCDFTSPNKASVSLTTADITALCTAQCDSDHFVATSSGTNWYRSVNCDGAFSVPNAIKVDGKTTGIELTWFDKDGVPSRIQSGDKNPTVNGVCIAYIEPVTTTA